MSKKHVNSKKIITTIFVIIFTMLSYFKFYTIQVSFNNDPTVAIVRTKDIQLLSNIYKITNSNLSYNWYDDYGFKFLYADEMGHMWQKFHSFIIMLWWISLIYILVIGIITVIQRLRNKRMKIRD
ncbi:hypothetical protein [Clostridium sp. UBA4548]|uniref:hypothetical protein n=1 Tax=Clostridium sp. UBA4548 TaxID=1946361 RepID=UPI0025BD3A12|nr:hypothetical protein [Clostridium sp. UBA4548]